jgi:hypothetical protein
MRAKGEGVELLQEQQIRADAAQAFDLTFKSSDALGSRLELAEQKRALAIEAMPRVQ